MEKNIVMKNRNANDTDWDDIFPITKATNVFAESGEDIESILEGALAELAEGGELWEIITDVTLKTDTAQVEFEDLGLENYRYLKIKINGLRTASNKEVQITFNDILTGYSYELSEDPTRYSRSYIQCAYAGDSQSNTFSEIDIFNTQNQRKTLIANYGSYDWGSATTRNQSVAGGLNSIVDITKITIKLESGALMFMGVTFTLMGVK